MTRRWEQPAECGQPEWKDTKRGRRCAAVCSDGRWKFVKKSQCEGGGGEGEESPETTPMAPEVEEFSGPPVGASFAPMEVQPIQPMPLFPLVEQMEPGGERPRRRRRSGRRG